MIFLCDICKRAFGKYRTTVDWVVEIGKPAIIGIMVSIEIGNVVREE